MQTLAEEMGVSDSLKSIALGQGQGELAEALVEKGIFFHFSLFTFHL